MGHPAVPMDDPWKYNRQIGWVRHRFRHSYIIPQSNGLNTKLLLRDPIHSVGSDIFVPYVGTSSLWTHASQPKQFMLWMNLPILDCGHFHSIPSTVHSRLISQVFLICFKILQWSVEIHFRIWKKIVQQIHILFMPKIKFSHLEFSFLNC